MSNSKYFEPLFVLGIIVLVLCFLIGYFLIKDDLTSEKTFCTIKDIKLVSAGGYHSSDKCLFDTTCGIVNLNGRDICNLQIGDAIVKIKSETHTYFEVAR